MAEIEESQRRIAAALSRIDTGIEALRARAPSEADIAEREALNVALEEERMVTAQLEERIRGLKERHAQDVEDARQAAPPSAEVMAIDEELQDLKQANAQLSENNRALREALEAGVSDPDLINQAMAAELDALRAERAAEVAETTAILAALEPMLAREGEEA